MTASRRRRLRRTGRAQWGIRRILRPYGSTEALLRHYKRSKVLWLGDVVSSTDFVATIQGLAKEYPDAFERDFCVESGTNFAPSTVFTVSNRTTYYGSCILQKSAGATAFLQAAPLRRPWFLETTHHDPSCWLFWGRNSQNRPVPGRPEHVDEVSHDGTWHLQISGAKTWTIRPRPEWRGPKIRGPNARRLKSGAPCFRLHVQQGDLLLINTRLWLHRTELPPGPLSISYARDFRWKVASRSSSDDKTNQEVDLDPRFFARAFIPRGTLALATRDMPDVDAIPRSRTPSCVVTTSPSGLALRASRDLVTGEPLTLPCDDDDDDGFLEYELDLVTGDLVPVSPGC